jgi:hypothetical protein
VIWLLSLAGAVGVVLLWFIARRRRGARRVGPRRILVPFTGGELDETVLGAAIRIALAEEATLVPAYLIVTPMEFAMDAPMQLQVDVAVPLLEAVECAAARAGVPVDARIESGRTPIHALHRLWSVEHFDRIVAPAPAQRGPGFTPKDLQWILVHAPSETVILKPDPQTHAADAGSAGVRSRAYTVSRRGRAKSSWRAERAGLRSAMRLAGIEPATLRSGGARSIP